VSAHTEASVPQSGESVFYKAPAEALRSAAFASEVAQLRERAVADHPRVGWRIADRSYVELQEELARNRSTGPQRPRAWRTTDVATDDGLRHVADYLKSCRRIARRYLHHEAAAELVHEEVCRGGVVERLLSVTLPTAEGARASSLAADATGASWGAGATSLAESRRQWVRPRAEEYRAAYEAAIEAARARGG
jgi:hypothetical protein